MAIMEILEITEIMELGIGFRRFIENFDIYTLKTMTGTVQQHILTKISIGVIMHAINYNEYCITF